MSKTYITVGYEKHSFRICLQIT